MYLITSKNNPSDVDIINVADDIGDLPEAEPSAPGHSLLQPSVDSLLSATKYPQKEDQMLVYGNLNNLGITYDKTMARVLYTSFRRSNNILGLLLEATNQFSRRPLLIYIRRRPDKINTMKPGYGNQVSEEENNGSEVLDDDELFGEANTIQDFRRKRKKRKYMKRESMESSQSVSSSSSESSDYERNPGNPYSVFKDKYLQNWMWNHDMDGDHMNINPYAPALSNAGPSGATLFFNRKWWYYNQDDYKPFD